MDSSLTVVGVASYFIQQYYRILQDTPEIAYQFYKDESSITRVLSDAEENASTVVDIHSVLTSLNYTGIEIFKLQCQDSLNGSILTVVSGSVKSRNFNGWRNFTQIFLVKHVDCYTVTNDELDSVTVKFNFKSMMRGGGMWRFARQFELKRRNFF